MEGKSNYAKEVINFQQTFDSLKRSRDLVEKSWLIQEEEADDNFLEYLNEIQD